MAPLRNAVPSAWKSNPGIGPIQALTRGIIHYSPERLSGTVRERSVAVKHSPAEDVVDRRPEGHRERRGPTPEGGPSVRLRTAGAVGTT